MRRSFAVVAGPGSDVPTAPYRALDVASVPMGTRRATVQVRGEVDLSTAPQLAAVLDDNLSSGHRFVRLDLSRVSFLDCAGLRLLVEAHNAFLAARGSLVLTGIDARIARLLAITHLDECLLLADGPADPPRARRRSHLSGALTG